MSNEEEVWQVAGRRRHRRPCGSDADQHQPGFRRPNNRHGSNSDAHGRRKGKDKSPHGGYSYKTSTRQPPLEQQVADGCREELVRKEIAKLEKLKVLLRATALWERLVDGLGSILAQLGLAAPGSSTCTAADVSPAVAASTGSMPACSGSTSGAASGRKADSPAEQPGSVRVLKELVCYGIGSFSESESSRYQLALALCLRDLLSVASGGSAGGGSAAAAAAADDDEEALGPAVLVFDPVMGETEVAILAALGCGTLENEEGKRSCCRVGEAAGSAGGGDASEEGEAGESSNSSSSTTPTLFFMPHCPQRLYSNVLWANWSSRALGSMVVLGNRLASYGDRLLDARARADPTNAVLRAGPLLLQDVDLPLPYPAASDRARWRRDVDGLPGLERAFNDLALSFSGPEARGSAEGIEALRDRPPEFVEAEDGELVTGRRASGAPRGIS